MAMGAFDPSGGKGALLHDLRILIGLPTKAAALREIVSAGRPSETGNGRARRASSSNGRG